jgi:serine/threonine protein kinase
MPKPLIPSGVEHPPIGTFFKTIVRSGLLDREQLQEVLRTGPAECRTDPESLADYLIKTGKLSRFQATKLLQGAARGLVLGNYQILAPIGKGGQSTVYLARDHRSQLLLALKVLPPKKAREEVRLLARFRREMDICQRVAHPTLAWVQEVGDWQGVYYIAMEFIPGKSLYRLVSDQGPLDVPRAGRLFAEVASGLDHAHSQGLIHRDLKPSNILVTPHDHAKVLDLGLALIQGEAPSDRAVVGGQGYVVGTMDYLAPEQADDAFRVDPRADIYSLGCTLYFALAARPPFPGGDSLQKIMRHHTDEPVPVEQLNAAVPAAFAELLRKMMAKRPEQRFASAAELREELLRWASDEPVLPPDRAGDSAYHDAVAAFDTDNAWAPLPLDVLPATPLPTRLASRGPVVLSLSQPDPMPPPDEHPSWVVYAVLVASGALAVLGMGVVVLLYVLLH